ALFCIVNLVHGQFHEEVHPDLSGDALLDALQDDYTPTFILTYSQARQVMYREIDNVNDSVTCVYSGFKKYLRPNSTDPIGDLISGGQNGINCEHTYPQSKGAGNGNARSNMHHLYPARAGVNEARSNHPFQEIDDNVTEDWYFEDRVRSSIPTTNIDAYSERRSNRFEAREDHKGDVARSVFYFYTIYRDQANAADANFFDLQDDELCQWHLMDPVDQKEWDRTYAIAQYQEGMVNPFVLDCTLAARLYCQDQPECIRTSTNSLPESFFKIDKVFPNPTDQKINLPFEIKQKGNIEISIHNLLGQNSQTLLNESHLPGAYQLSFDLSKSVARKQFVLLKFHFTNEHGSFIRFFKISLL
ncbi:MAG: endonuclease, partial [Bacteroidota bacterium]